MSLQPEQIAKISEQSHQCAYFAWAREYAYRYSDSRLNFICGSANGGARSIVTAANMKAAGVNKGFPDIFLPCPRFNMTICGLFIEMKVESRRNHRNGGLDDAQVVWRDFILTQGCYEYAICYNWMEARDVTMRYLNIT